MDRRSFSRAPISLLLALAACVPRRTGERGAGERLLLAREDGLWTAPLDGRSGSRLTSPERGAFDKDPTLSPDGRQLVFSRTPAYQFRPGQPFSPAALPQTALYVAAADGSGARRLAAPGTQAPGAALEHAVWHPSGKVLYATLTTLRFVGNAVVGQQTEIVRLEAADGALKTAVPDASFPAAAPDGRRLAYVRSDPNGSVLYVAELAADGAHTANERAVLTPGRLDNLMYPRFSPDGRRLAVSAVPPGAGTGGILPRAAGSAIAPTLVAPTPAPARRSGGPSLRSVLAAALAPLEPARAAAHGLPMDVFMVQVDGAGLRRLTELWEDEPSSAWSPDGSRVAVLGPGGLYLVPAAGGEARKLDSRGGRGALVWAAR